MKELNKYKLRLILCIILVCVALVTVLIALHEAYMLYEEIQWAIRVDFGVERILRASRGRFVTMALGALLGVWGLVDLVRIPFLIRRINRIRTEDPRAAASAERAVRSELAQGGDRYLQQLDEYLRNGIIDREEYKILKKRHQQGR